MTTRLQAGDRLSRAEFHRQYLQAPDWLQAELVDGAVHIRPKRVTTTHSSASAKLAAWLGYYEVFTPGLWGGIRPTLLIDETSELQPDVVLRIHSDLDGASSINSDGFLEGSPELVTEVIDADSNTELCAKAPVYRRNGVREYIVWRTWDREVDWFKLQQGEFVKQVPDEQGWIKSTVFPGLWLDCASLLAGQSKRVLTVLQLGIDSAEHAEFVTKLEAQRRR